MTMPSKPVLALTMGDPAGVGPELCLRMLADPAVLDKADPVIFGDAALLRRVARALGMAVPAKVIALSPWQAQKPAPLEGELLQYPAAYSSPGSAEPRPPSPSPRAPLEGELLVLRSPACGTKRDPREPLACIVDLACLAADAVVPGQVSAACGAAAYRCVEVAIQEALAGRVAGIVTAPLNKQALHMAGVPHPGHTEILAALTGTRRYCMTLASERITTSLVTTHTSLASVPGKLNKTAILDVIRLTADAMQRLRGRRPRLAVCALNPHGGEGGLFGDEETRHIAPAVAQARAEGLDIEGPLAPDTAFLPSRMDRTDAYICMYHDQGLIPFKMLAFETGVNITLGLPIVRTSPDHGTAFDIAWTGKADPGSMRQAILYAARLAAG